MCVFLTWGSIDKKTDSLSPGLYNYNQLFSLGGAHCTASYTFLSTLIELIHEPELAFLLFYAQLLLIQLLNCLASQRLGLHIRFLHRICPLGLSFSALCIDFNFKGSGVMSGTGSDLKVFSKIRVERAK